MGGLVTKYSVATDFVSSGTPHRVYVDIFRREIIDDPTITQTPNFITVDGDVVDVDFTTPLSAGEITALDAIVAAHPTIVSYQGEQRQVFTALVPPTADEDADDRIDVGDLWIDTVTGKSYIIVDNTVGVAIWKLLAPEAGAAIVQTRDPLATDDTTQGISIGDTWVNTVTGIAWVCTSNTTGAAVWKFITPTIMGGLIVQGNSAAVFTHNSLNYQEKLSISTGTILAGNYMLFYSYKWNIDSTAHNFDARIQQDNTTVIHHHVEEATESGGSFESTGSSQKMPASGWIPLTLGGGSYQFDLDFKAPVVNVAVSMWDARMYFQRVA